MARSDLIRRLFLSYSAGDDAAFHQVARELIAEERRQNHRDVARALEHALLTDRRPGVATPLTLRPIPKSRDDRPLVGLTKPERELNDLVLHSSTRTVIEEIISENMSRSTLTSHGLQPRRRLLLVGPPGTGKTATAHAIAAELSLPVATASLPALTSSFLGDTARNIEAVVRFAEQTPCVLLLDEFDVLGQERSQAGDHGEMRRVAATVLQLLEDVRGESLIAATSNHPQALDTAIWRRFDELLIFETLGHAQLAELIKLKLRAMPTEVSVTRWAKVLRGFSPAEVELVCLDAMRRTLLAGQPIVDDTSIAAALQLMRNRQKAMSRAATRYVQTGDDHLNR